jgi:hypothetical protein
VSALSQFLAYPPDAADRGTTWEFITAGQRLFDMLHEAVHRQTLEDWDEILGNLWRWLRSFWFDRQHPKRSERLRACLSALRLVSAAQNAQLWRRDHGTRPDELDRLAHALSRRTARSTFSRAWQWGCFRTLLDPPARRERVSVYVVVLGRTPGESDVAALSLELLDGGCGESFHHPVDAFRTKVDAAFRASMLDAWEAAAELVCREAEATGGTTSRTQPRGAPLDPRLCAGRWRLLDLQGAPLTAITGDSAGGAAARGWWFALMGKMPDSGIVVLARVIRPGAPGATRDQFTLGSVAGVAEKAKAIEKAATAGRCPIDTIVVANAGDATAALNALGGSELLDVVDVEGGTRYRPAVRAGL